ncbi:MAG TPA: zf-HC2 domain-containing protein [Gemmatimonadales bacterium]|nr:zf-HC2 domain-containing protein [Gemmatimonadales bacterium]
MRHIPEEELHAYLDQALSRSQAVEIESHLAGCDRCRAVRDDAALLRDRTTALLTRLGPGTIPLPPFEVIRRRAAVEQRQRRTFLRRAAWAASIAMAAGLGWASRRILPAPASAAPAVIVTAPPAAGHQKVPADQHLPATPVTAPAIAVRHPPTRNIRGTVESDSLRREPAAGPAGLWHSVSLAGAAAAGTPIPRVAGLPVLQIQLQESPEATPVVAVDQQMANGQTVRTIEGPAGQVWNLYTATTVPTDSAGTSTLSLRQGDRMLFMTARVSPDSLRAMIGKLLMR